ncbi:MAG: Conserved membrane protein, possible 4-hydroxybenzoate octaprenyltransferase [Candidatus Ozemobacter sibiricus]|jgi:4-hydroxybenzoate polyprenyltransferase|uniref:Conserved membrane protein, possible 4-hydroxybenzoate octaprenyltransferase n=1 Tax=Candidatus Ozemobacter sibiricus TaxID=2268124 RepID=A0A367ZRK8_9BACT|nr:MAG: Conserved membrane protein, possible 4-hydroxybenzoate octaprenyltransferase [Candidatus Ozemobacter sibiricus]
MFPLLASLRPRQWVKNLLVMAGLIFSEKHLLTDLEAWLAAGSAFLIFCGLSGSVYLLNDLVDLERDRQHPDKAKRPLAAGHLSVARAQAGLGGLLFFCLGGASLLPIPFFVAALLYLVLNVAYSLWLKRVVIIDVMCVATGFVLRAEAGVAALRVVDPQIYMSKWLLICTFLLALFLILAKRRQEVRRFAGTGAGNRTREALAGYSAQYIDELSSIVCAATVIAYAIYTVSPDTKAKFGTEALVYTIPPVIYGIFRYLYLIHIEGRGENPSELCLTDRPLQATLVVWVLIVVAILHGPTLLSYLSGSAGP